MPAGNFDSDQYIETTAKPDIQNLKKELREALAGGAGNVWNNYSKLTGYDSLYHADFADKQPDGMKFGKDVIPFEGATDSESRLIQNYHSNFMSLLEKADSVSNFQVDAVGEQDLALAPIVKRYLDYQVKVKCKDNWDAEMELMRSYTGLYGWSALHVFWDRRIYEMKVPVTTEDVAKTLGPEVLVDGPDIPKVAQMTGGSEEEVAKVFDKLFRTGKANVPVKRLAKDQPAIKALKPYADIFLSISDDDLPEDSRIVFRVERYTLTELENMALTEKWNREWVEQALLTINKRRVSNGAESSGNSSRNGYTSNSNKDNRVEIIQAYSKRMDKDKTVRLFRTVFSDLIDGYALHEELLGLGGMMPFVFFRYDNSQKNINFSTGIAERGRDLQNRLKKLQDLSQDRIVLETLPALIVKGGDPFSKNMDITPGSQVDVSINTVVEFLEPPKGSVDMNVGMQALIRAEGDKIFGCYNEAIPTMETQEKRQWIADNYLRVRTRILRRIWSLSKSFESDETWAKITESQLKMPRESENFDFYILYDVKQEDPEFATQAVEQIAKITEVDQSGVVDKGKAVEMALMLTSPALAKQIIRTSADAQKQIYNEVNQQLALIALGNPAELKQENEIPDAEMRLQVVNQIIDSNPKYQEMQEKDIDFQRKLKQYVDNLSFAAQQRRNAVVGRLGAKPV